MRGVFARTFFYMTPIATRVVVFQIKLCRSKARVWDGRNKRSKGYVCRE